MDCHLIYILASLVGFSVAIEVRSAKYNTLVKEVVSDGLEYKGRLYDSTIECGVQCLSEGCETFAVSQAGGGAVYCVYNSDQDDLPKGRWEIHGNPPSKLKQTFFNL